MRVISLLGLAALLSSCVTYVPVPPAAPRPGVTIRAYLTDSASEALAMKLGPGIGAVEGRVVNRNAAGIEMALSSAYFRFGGGSQTRYGESLEVPRVGIAAVEQRKLSAMRTALFAGAAVLGAVGLVLVVDAAADGGGSGGGSKPPPARIGREPPGTGLIASGFLTPQR